MPFDAPSAAGPMDPSQGMAPGLEDWLYQDAAPSAAAQVTGAPALDANLLTSLMRWVGGVKRRLGSGQLEGFLEIYKLTGHLPPVVEKLIYTLADLEALPDESADQVFTLDELMDSLLQLHAVVYGPGYASRGATLNLEEQSPEDVEGDG